MKLKRTTLILIALALGLSGFVYFYEIQGAQQREAAKAKEGKIFSFEEQQIQAFTITTQQQTLKFERVNQKPGDMSQLNQWQMKAPTEATASDPSVSYLLNLLVKGKSDRTFTIPANRLQEYGLDKPLATVEVKLKNQQSHQLILGKPDFNHTFIYAQAADSGKNTQQLQVLLVPVEFEYAVKRPLSEWKQTKEDTSNKKPDKSPPNKSDKASPSPAPTNSEKSTPEQSDKVTPSPAPTNSEKSTPEKSDKATPSPAPTNSEKSTSEQSDKANPSPAPTKSEKSTPQNTDKATPSPSP